MLRRLSLGLLASAISVASLPAIAQEDSGADDLGVMSISHDTYQEYIHNYLRRLIPIVNTRFDVLHLKINQLKKKWMLLLLMG